LCDSRNIIEINANKLFAYKIESKYILIFNF
jgi:hypothetical protein